MDYKTLAQIMFPNVTETPEDMEIRFPQRNLKEGAKVTRIAPSPTGFIHFGTLFPALVSERLAHQSNGVFFLRVEDTDSKREVEGAEVDLINSLAYYNIKFDEGHLIEGSDNNYGPYKQSLRKSIYHVYAKYLVENNLAYPCFCSEEELNSIRNKQEAAKETPGYHGEWAIHRNMSADDAAELINQGRPYVLRLRSDGSIERKTKIVDLIKGELLLPENDEDFVLLKSDGIPTYHFAHAVDDHLMGTTHVIRGEEWLSSLPKHIQLFRYLNFKLPKFMHISQLMKLEGSSKKKLSKRDKGASLADYRKIGFPWQCVIEYVMTLLNSNFEEWRRANKDKPYTDFPFSIKKMSASGSLFDYDKLCDVSKNIICTFSAEYVYDNLISWTKEFDTEFYSLLTSDKEYAIKCLSIGRNVKNPRKDFATWSDVKPYMSIFYDSIYTKETSFSNETPKDTIKSILNDFVEIYDENDDNSTWFDKIKSIGSKYNFCPDMKEYKNNPSQYQGSVADVSSFIRIAVTGRTNSPDMYDLMKVLGKERVITRINKAIESEL